MFFGNKCSVPLELVHAEALGTIPRPLPPCRAAFHGDLQELRRLLPGLSLRQKLQFDTQGNTVQQANCTQQHLGRL